MHRIDLSCLGEAVSRIALGTVKLGRNLQVKYPEPFVIPDDRDAIALLRKAVELGVNVIDTAPAYGNSEQRLGNLLPQAGGDWLIISKAGEEFINGQSYFDFRQQSLIDSVERSLRRLGRDVIDVVLIHSNGDDARIIEQFLVFDTLHRLKQQGKIRAGGFSSKTHEGALLTLAHSDLLMCELPSAQQELDELVDGARSGQSQLLVKKAFASGHLLNSADREQVIATSLARCFAVDEVASVVLGTVNPDHLAMNLTIANQVLDCCS